MGESYTNVTEGSGKKQHSWQRTVGANNVEDSFILPGEFPHPSYMISAYNISTATSSSHIVQLMAGSSNVVRVRRINIRQKTAAGTAAIAEFDVLRLTSAGTGGSVLGNNKMVDGDAAAGASAMTLPSSKGTEGTSVAYLSLLMVATATTVGGTDTRDQWVSHPSLEPIVIPAGTSNGIAVKLVAGIASGAVTVLIEFSETSYL